MDENFSFYSAAQSLPLDDVKKILVCKLRHHGDVLLSSPVFSCLKKRFPQASIGAYLYQETYPMLAGHPAIDRFHLCKTAKRKQGLWGKISEEWELVSAIRQENYDIAINLTEGDRGALIGYLSGAKIRLGVDPEGGGMLAKKHCYTHLAKLCKSPRHTVEKNLDVIRSLGVFPSPEERALTLHIDKTTLASACEKLQEGGVTPGSFIVIHPAARWRFKCLEPHIMRQVLEKLLKTYQQVVFTASPDTWDVLLVHQIVKGQDPARVINLAGKTTLQELAAVIELSQGLICVDSVPLHIASALKKPVVTVFGPTSSVNWGPWMHPLARVLSANMSCQPCYMNGCGGSNFSDCLTKVSAHQIVQAFRELVPAANPSKCYL